MSTASEILGRIEDDPVFKGFLEAGFDPAAFASKIVKADVGKATGSAAPVLLQEEGAVLSSGGGAAALDQRLASASAESVSSQAEITLDVSFKLVGTGKKCIKPRVFLFVGTCPKFVCGPDRLKSIYEYVLMLHKPRLLLTCRDT